MQRITVDILTAKAFQRGDQVGADALGNEVTVQVGLRVQRPRAAIAAHGHPGHGLDAAGHHQVFEPGTHFHGRQVHRLQARGAKPIELHACHADIPIGHQRSSLGDIGPLFTHRGHTTEHDVIDLAGVQIHALLQGA